MHDPMPPVRALGGTLDEFRGLLDIQEPGELLSVDDSTDLWTFRRSGIAANLVDGRVSGIFLYSEGYEGFSAYQGDTAGLRLDSSRQIVRFRFGVPSRYRDVPDNPMPGPPAAWDRYDYETCSLHFQYDGTGKWLRMVTIMTAEEVRRIDDEAVRKGRGPVVYDKAKYHDESVRNLGLPESQAAVHTAFFLGWLMENGLCSDEFVEESHADIEAYRQRRKTALAIYGYWDYCLVDDMLSEEGNAFAQSYFDFATGQYLKDYDQLFVRRLPSEFHVEYTWENQKRINHQISSRYRRWKRRQSAPAIQPALAGRVPVADVGPRRPERARLRASRLGDRGRRVLTFLVFPVLIVFLGLVVIWWADSL